MGDVVVKSINTGMFNPFGATEDELVAYALDVAGLMAQSTQINNTAGREVLQSFFHKRENYRSTTKLGALLIKNDIIEPKQLEEALRHQQQHPGQKLGEVIIGLGFCTENDIDSFLQKQREIRGNIDELIELMKKMNLLRSKLTNQE